MENLQPLLNFFKKLYTPLPQCTTNHIEDALLLKKNRITFWFLFVLMITQPLLMYLSKLTWQIDLIMGCWKAAQLHSFYIAVPISYLVVLLLFHTCSFLAACNISTSTERMDFYIPWILHDNAYLCSHSI